MTSLAARRIDASSSANESLNLANYKRSLQNEMTRSKRRCNNQREEKTRLEKLEDVIIFETFD